jgi:hypothetical protein
MRGDAGLGTAGALRGLCEAKFSSYGNKATLMASKPGQRLHYSFHK